MHEHMSLRERLAGLIENGREPTFETSTDPTLVAFAQIFADSGLFALDANKHLRSDALSPIYDCETESRSAPDSEPVKFVVTWAPVWQRDLPVTGFRTGRDSTLLGSTPTIAMPQDERTAALLLLVTTPFVHLSATREGAVPLVRGAIDTDNNDFGFVALDPSAFPAGNWIARTTARTTDVAAAEPGGLATT
jgi:hypothetical protein